MRGGRRSVRAAARRSRRRRWVRSFAGAWSFPTVCVDSPWNTSVSHRFKLLQALPRRGLSRFGPQCLLELLTRAGPVAARGQDRAEVRTRVGVLWIQSNRPVQLGHGLVEVPELREGHSKVAVNAGVVV